MYYGDKREAKVKIMYKLVDAGWKVFGYSPDQSDSMTDYYHPASWSGVASKNGYVLLIDVYGLSDSGREVRKYNYNNKAYVSNARIEKLTAMMNDPASTENEKASCATLIEKEMEKGNVEPTYTVVETYPTFMYANPKGTTWHIEKEGQIIAKGKGVFSTNTYDWENKELNGAQQKEIKINAFVERIEKVLKDSDALQPVVIKVPVKTTKAVEKNVTSITDADIKEGFTFAMKVAYTHGNSKGTKYSLVHKDEQYNKYHTFAKLGKTNKPSKSIDKSWSLSVERINELLSKGHIAIIEFVEVTEYQEKTVFKKTSRKQAVSNAPAIETTEEVKETVNSTGENEVAETNDNVTVKLNEELNGVELYFSGKPSEEIREQLKANGFRWSKRGFWYAKQNTKTLAYIKGFKASEEVTEPAAEPEQMQHKEQEASEEISNTSNVIYHDFQQNEEKEGEQPAMTNDAFEDIFSKFENIDITAEQQTSSEDIEFCKEQEEIYNKLIKAHSSLIPQLQEIHEQAENHSKKYTKQSSGYTTAYAYSLKPSEIEKTMDNMKNKFISAVCHYFMNKYSVTINYESIQSKYNHDVTHEKIINEITNQLGGYNFKEKAEQEIKENLRESFTWKKAENKGKKMILNNFLYIDTSWKKWGEEKIHYNSNDKLNTLFKALQHFENGSINMNEQFETLYKQLVNGKNEAVFIKHDLNFSKFQSIKIFKNGKVEIEFATSQHADNFNKTYCFSNVA